MMVMDDGRQPLMMDVKLLILINTLKFSKNSTIRRGKLIIKNNIGKKEVN